MKLIGKFTLDDAHLLSKEKFLSCNHIGTLRFLFLKLNIFTFHYAFTSNKRLKISDDGPNELSLINPLSPSSTLASLKLIFYAEYSPDCSLIEQFSSLLCSLTLSGL
ncbi:unnamed protein product [Didymodactylos carnosus]|uniref:Uncharacterized protein n=1 Tax=Didymodactylos carnosus TaxID=1234261 RepID=A0A815ZCF5_9BILA|nr:unnamed protein product [Didymodactylos carnosus]CAF4448099.1 unnamed protein product [Didymodactylos carnosus]